MTVNELLRERRIGRVVISFDLLNALDWEEVKAITEKVLPVETQQSLIERSIYQTCVSPYFRALLEGETAPIYQLIIRPIKPSKPKGKIKYSVEVLEVAVDAGQTN